MTSRDRHLWWQTGVIYQIYPRSFQDSNADGIGDLRGIGERLDYLTWLGVDAIWLSPVYPSPMADFGYDVADHRDVDPLFGTLDDLDALVEACHQRGLKVLLDFVPNHTSNRHPWFADSASGRDSSKRNWYLWHDPGPDGGPPNNWLSVFGGSAWEYHAATQQYYYHAFLKEQPDLNWRNPDVREAMLDVLRFWFDRGIDGFRIDVLWHVIKDEHLRDNPINPSFRSGDNPYHRLLPVYSTDQPEALEVAAAMRAVADLYDERVLVGEIYLPVERLVAYYGAEGGGVHLPFNFQLLTLPWNAREIDRAINEYEGALPADGWPNWVLGNHDRPRIATRAGGAQARVAAMLLLTLRGTPTLYYGDELGLADVPIPEERMQDPQGLRLGLRFSRDPCRTPMPWDGSEHGGFTAGAPWLPLNRDLLQRNVAAEREDADSMLTLYRRLLAVRRQWPALAVGDYRPVAAEGDVIAYERQHDSERLLVVLNLGERAEGLALGGDAGTVILGTHPDREGERIARTLALRGNEGLVIELGGRGEAG